MNHKHKTAALRAVGSSDLVRPHSEIKNCLIDFDERKIIVPKNLKLTATQIRGKCFIGNNPL